MSRFLPSGLGWLPNCTDPRDFRLGHPEVQALLGDLKIGRSTRKKSVDLREFFPPVENQGQLNSSCAFVVLGLVEYFDARCEGEVLERSKLFLYQMALRMRGLSGDVGVDLRTTFKALTRFGSPPQRYWPYEPQRLKETPVDPFLFGFAREYEQLCYFRLDFQDQSAVDRLNLTKSLLASGFPCGFGFVVPSSLSADARITDSSSAIHGGQAVIAVGFDDNMRIASHKGALLIRSSWGSGWGEEGFGWLPYEFVRKSKASDFWSALKVDWAASAGEW